MTNLKTWMLRLATNEEAERSDGTMIEKPSHVEPSRPLANEKPSSNGNHYPILGEIPRVGRPMRLVIAGAILLIAILTFIPSWIQKWLWMRQLGYAGVFWTLLSVRWELFCVAFVVALLYYNTGDRMKYWGKMGAFWGAIWGWLFGAAFFAIRGIGPILVGGPLVAWIVAALEGAVVVGGLSALGAGLYSIGIPKDSVVEYESALKSDKFLLLAHGTADEVAKAKSIMQATHPVEVAVHAAKHEQRAGSIGR